jgi:hypothetical protein
MKYRLFLDSRGETIEDASVFEDVCSAYAIEQYCKYLYDNCDGWEWMPKDNCSTVIRCVDENDVVKDFRFEIEYEPEFYVYENTV